MSELYIDTIKTIKKKYRLEEKDMIKPFITTWNCNFFDPRCAKWSVQMPSKSMLVNPKFKVNLSLRVLVNAREDCPDTLSKYIGDEIKVRPYPISNITDALYITLNNQHFTSQPIKNVKILKNTDQSFHSEFITKTDDNRCWCFDVTLTESFDVLQELFNEGPQQVIPNMRSLIVNLRFSDNISNVFYIDNFNGSLDHDDVTDKCRLPLLKDINVALTNATLILDCYMLAPDCDVVFPYVKKFKDHTIFDSSTDKLLLPGETVEFTSPSLVFSKKPSNIILFVNDKSLHKWKSVVLSQKNIKIDSLYCYMGNSGIPLTCNDTEIQNNAVELKPLMDNFTSDLLYFHANVKCTNTNNYPINPTIYIYYEYESECHIHKDGNVEILS